jgi:hypothetical protein
MATGGCRAATPASAPRFRHGTRLVSPRVWSLRRRPTRRGARGAAQRACHSWSGVRPSRRSKPVLRRRRTRTTPAPGLAGGTRRERHGHYCSVQRTGARAAAVERLPDRGPVSDRGHGSRAGWPDPVPVLTSPGERGVAPDPAEERVAADPAPDQAAPDRVPDLGGSGQAPASAAPARGARAAALLTWSWPRATPTKIKYSAQKRSCRGAWPLAMTGPRGSPSRITRWTFVDGRVALASRGPLSDLC